MDIRELCSLLKHAGSAEEIDRSREEILALLPAADVMIGYDQRNRAHQYDLWFHSLHTVINLPRDMADDMLYLAALLHDIGKPDCQTVGEYEGKVNMHYYGHPQRSLEIVEKEIVPTLEWGGNILSGEEKKRLFYYVAYHDDRVSLREKHLKRHLNMVPLEEFQRLMLLEAADAKAHIQLPVIAERVRICEALSGVYGLEVYRCIFESD